MWESQDQEHQSTRQFSRKINKTLAETRTSIDNDLFKMNMNEIMKIKNDAARLEMLHELGVDLSTKEKILKKELTQCQKHKQHVLKVVLEEP